MIPLLLSLGVLHAAPIPAEIEDEQALGINKIPYHSVLMPYGNLQQALNARRDRSSFARSLNGTWKFHYVKRPEERPADFYRTDYDVSKWDTIHVPSNWQVLGYGTPYYKNNGYTFKRDWPRVMSEPPKDWTAYDERNPVGSYKRSFDLPATWEGRRVYLTFDGVDAGFFLWINGQRVGYSQNSRNAAEFDITKFLRPGKNEVSVEVYRYTAGSYMEDQDMWRLSGIFRNVTLWSAPKEHIQDTFVTGDLDSSYTNGLLQVRAKVRNDGTSSSAPRRLSVTVYDDQRKVVATGIRPVSAIRAGDERTVAFTVPVAKPKKWSAETPNLYTAVLDLGNGEELISHRVGFRKVEIKGRVFMVNGKPVKLKGANRHEMSPETGHYVTEADMVKDLVMLKKANCNHVRTCHYSDDPRWYELCDEWGIYLVAEANVECHGYYNVLDREPRFERMIVDRNVANVENFKIHPSVVIWSMGNECGGGSNLRAAEKAVRALDPSRPTHYEAFGIGGGNPAGIDSQMYTSPDSLERIAQDGKLNKPMYLCEYAHAMNNSMGAIGEYNDLFDKYPALMGGAIWEWEDQGLWNRRDPKHSYLAYGGGFGEVPNDGYFIHKGVVFSDRSPKPHFPEAKRAYQWIGFADEGHGRIRIKNKFAFTNLAKYDLKWSVISDSGVVTKGSMAMPTIAPGMSQAVALPLPAIKPSSGTDYYLNIAATLREPERWAGKGYEIANGQFPLAKGPIGETLPAGKLSFRDSRNSGLRVDGEGFSMVFDRATGTLSELLKGGKNMLLPGGGPKLHLWRAQHRNDDGWAASGWAAAGLKDLKPEVLDLHSEKEGDQVVVFSSVRYSGNGGFSVTHLTRYTIYGDGTVVADNAVSPSGPNIALARVGVRMLLDPSLKDLQYFARGPMENYADRKRGSDLGRYSSTVQAQMTPYPKPQECGNHEDMKWLTLTGKGGAGLVAMADQEPLQFSALPYRDEEMEDAPYRYALPTPSATVLILSGKTLGVGSAACGPRPLPEYRLDCTPRTFSYVLRIGASRPAVPARFMQGGPILLQQVAGGRTALVASTPIQISEDGNTWSSYSGPLAVETPTKLWVRTAGFTGRIAIDPLPAKLAWKVTASSYESGEGDPVHAIDNDGATFWHSHWSGESAKPPHFLVVDFVKPLSVGKVLLTPRQDGNGNGRIRGYAIYLSNDGQNWGTAVAQGTLQNRDSRQTVRLPQAKTARYLKLVVLSDYSNGGFASLAELDVEP